MSRYHEAWRLGVIVGLVWERGNRRYTGVGNLAETMGSEGHEKTPLRFVIEVAFLHGTDGGNSTEVCRNVLYEMGLRAKRDRQAEMHP